MENPVCIKKITAKTPISYYYLLYYMSLTRFFLGYIWDSFNFQYQIPKFGSFLVVQYQNLDLWAIAKQAKIFLISPF